jgi:hypothetical protein
MMNEHGPFFVAMAKAIITSDPKATSHYTQQLQNLEKMTSASGNSTQYDPAIQKQLQLLRTILGVTQE